MNTLINKPIASDFNNYDKLEKEYFIFYISFFDHFLSEDEYANADLVCYADVDTDPNKRQNIYSLKFYFK